MKHSAIILLTFIFSVGCHAAELPVLKVTFPASSLTDEYIQGEMTLTDTDGSVTTLPARMKVRGATSKQYSMKPSFNMKLKSGVGEEFDTVLLGIRRTSSYILDAMAIDRICMRNRVSFDIWNSLYRLPYETDFESIDGTTGQFVEVYLNDVYKGIYCMSDKINRKLLDLKKPQVDDKGNVTVRGVLYKNGTNDIGDQSTPGFFNDYTVYVARYHDAWELHEPEDYPSPAAWAPLVEYYSDGNYNSPNYISSHFESENMLDYTLLIMVLSIGDNWGNKNRYFSMKNSQSDGEKATFIITPWDLDTALGGSSTGKYYDGNYSNWSPSDIMKSVSAPFAAFYGINGMKEQLKQRWLETREECFSVESVAQRMYDYCNLFESSGAWERQCEYWDQQKNKPLYMTNLRGEINQIVEWYKARYAEIDSYFNVNDESTDSDTSAIDDITEDEIGDNNPIYDIKGVRVEKSMLRPGMIYIQKGKKFKVQ